MRKRFVTVSAILFVLLATYALATLNLSVSAPSDGDIISGSIPVNASFDGVANVTIQFQNDSGWFLLNWSNNTETPYVYLFDTTNYQDGEPYAFNITATNASNTNDTESVLVQNLIIDNVPPTVTINVPVSQPYDGLQSIIINASFTDQGTNVSLCNYSVYNASGIAFSDFVAMTLSYDDGSETGYGEANGTIVAQNLTSGGGYNITVRCSDYLGHYAEGSANFGYDADMPGALLNSFPMDPIAGQVNITGWANDSFSMTNYTIELLNDTGTYMLCYNMTQRTNDTLCAWNTAGYVDGSYNITLTVNDNVSHSSTSTLLSVNVSNAVTDLIAPFVTIMTPGTGTFRGVVNFTVNIFDNQSEVNASRAFLINGSGGNLIPLTLYAGDTAEGNWSAAIDTTAFADGPQNFTFNISDNAGNTNISQYLTLTLDNTGPNIVVFSPAETAYSNQLAFNAIVTPTDPYAGSISCNLSMYNGSLYAGNFTTSIASGAMTNLTVPYLGPGNWSWNVTCWDDATLMYAGGLGNSYTNTTRHYIIDVMNVTIPGNGVWLAQPDIFVSADPANNNITVRVNASDIGLAGVNYVTVDFTGVQGLNATNATNIGEGIWEATAYAWNGVGVNFTQVNLTVEAYDNAGNPSNLWGAMTPLTPIVYYNQSVPPNDGQNCMAFGSLTTNLNQEPNFNSVNLINEIQLNGSASCNPQSIMLPWGDSFRTVLLMNFTSVNFSNPSVAQLFAMMPYAIQVQITPPGQFGDSFISVNSSMFEALNTNATLTFYGLPFTTAPGVVAENASRQGGVTGVSYVSAYSAEYSEFLGENVSAGNLTFSVGGFSAYNVTDDIIPEVSINSPVNGANVTTSTPWINVTLNGTGTTISQAVFSINGQPAAIFNDSINTANCTQDSPGSERYACVFQPSPQSDGPKNLSVTAYDYGGLPPGNNATATRNFVIDANPPTAAIVNPANNTNTTDSTPEIFFTLVDSLDTSIDYIIFVDGSENLTGSATNGSVSSENLSVADGVYTIVLQGADDVGNYANSTPLTLTVDTTAPVTSDNASFFAGWQTAVFNVTLTPSDATSGVAYTSYRLDNGSWQNGTVVAITTEGNHSIDYYSVDYAGNVESPTTVYAALDTVEPSISITSPTIAAQSTYSIVGTVSDAGSGVSYVQISINSTVVGNATVNGSNWNYTRSTTAGVNETILAAAYDLAGLSANDSQSDIIIDDSAPTIGSVSSGDPSTTSATITWSTDESANETIHYGTSTSFGSIRTSTSFSTSHSMVLTGLTEDTTYYYNVTSCDHAGNCDTDGPNTFTTDEEVVDGGTGGGSSGGGSTMTAGNPLTTTAKRVSLTRYGTQYFQVNADRNSHKVRIKEFRGKGVVLTFSSDPVDVFLEPGDVKNVDVTSDGTPDVIVELESVSQTSIIFSLKQYRESTSTTSNDADDEPEEESETTPLQEREQVETQPAASANEPSQGSDDTTVDEGDTGKKDRSWWWLGIVFAALIIGLLLIVFRQKPPEVIHEQELSGSLAPKRDANDIGDAGGYYPPRDTHTGEPLVSHGSNHEPHRPANSDLKR